MRIIVLRGPANSGKSTVLNGVYNELTSFRDVHSTPKRVLGNPKQKDFECIITLKDKRRVAFFTMGDYIDAILAGIEKYSYLDCEVLIIAFNDDHDAELNKIDSVYPHNIISKSLPYKNDVSRLKDIGTILSKI